MTEAQKDQPTEQPSIQTTESPEQATAETSQAPDAQLRELQQKLEAAEKLAEAYKDQLLRKAAEFENYKKRTVCNLLDLETPELQRIRDAAGNFHDDVHLDGSGATAYTREMQRVIADRCAHAQSASAATR